MPTISIIIPAYNVERYIGNALRSVLAQTWQDFEVIVVDDGSRDRTRAVVERWMKESPKIRLLRMPRNGGVSAARNAGIAESRGAWIALLDADDSFEPTRLEALLAVARREEAALVADNLRGFDLATGADLGDLFGIPADGRVHEIGLARFIDSNVLEAGHDGLGRMKPLIDRAFLDRHGIRYREDLRSCEDYDLYYEVLKTGGRAVILGESLYRYGVRPDSLSHSTFSMEVLETMVALSASELAYQRTAAPARADVVAAMERRHASLRHHLGHLRFVEALKARRPVAALRAAGVCAGVWRLVLHYGMESVAKRLRRAPEPPAAPLPPAPVPEGTQRICVAALTCARPRGLRNLLEGLGGIAVPEGASVEVLIVDNNPDGSAEPILREFQGRLPFALHYHHERRRGISQARNAALDFAHGRADFLAFIDDDEVPQADWLTELVRVQRATGAEGVIGPVLPRFEEPAPRWAVDGDFFAHRCKGPHAKETLEDGAPVPVGNGGNVLLRADLVGGETGLRFDAALGATGGEDTLLFEQMRSAGYRLCYASNAIAWETIPASRVSVGWLLRRWYRTGNTEAFIRFRDALDRGRAIAFARGLVRVVAGCVLLVATAILSGGKPARVIGSLYTIARGIGMIAFCFKHQVREYQVIHGH